MNLSSLIVLLLIIVAVWYAIRTLRRNDGSGCHSCHPSGGCSQCPHCRR